MRILGIDPSVRVVGWGVLDSTSSQKFVYIASDTLRTNPTEAMPVRLSKLYKKLEGVINNYQPHVIGLETVFIKEDPKAILRLNYMRGIVLLLAGLLEVKVVEISPCEVKKGTTGSGRAGKDKVQSMLPHIIASETQLRFGSFDESDALSIAYAVGLRCSAPEGLPF